MQAEIIAVGSELLTPSRRETNSLHVTQRLNELGIRVRRKWVVGDHPGDLRQSLQIAMEGSSVIVFTGGLGPTTDDITREVVAQTLGRRLLLDESILKRLEQRFRRLGLQMTENNRRQAYVPEAAEVLENPHGSAPGLFLKEGSVLVFLLPGPPHELEPMVVNEVVPRIRKHLGVTSLPYRQLRVASLPESRVDSMAEGIYRDYPDVETTILSSPGVIDLFFYWTGGAEAGDAGRVLDELTARLREAFGSSIFTDRNEGLEEVVGSLLRRRGLTLATAESCTGGWLGQVLTSVPGSSHYYRGGVVCYHDELKSRLAGVNETTLERFGAVSEAVVLQMAEGIRRRAGADYGLSVTGIAGPGGGTREKPVGLVYVALAGPDCQEARELHFSGPREVVRLRSARFALDLLRRHLL